MTRRLPPLPLRPGTLGSVAAAALTLACAEFVRSGLYAAYLPQAGPRELGLPLTAVGAAWTAHFAADTLMRSPAGALIARFGLRPVMLAGALLSLAALTLLPLAHHVGVLILIAVVHGIGFSAMWPGTMNLTADAARPGYQGRALTFVSLTVMPLVGGGFLLFGAVAGRADRWPYLLALAVQALAVLAALAVPVRGPRPAAQPQEEPAPSPAPEARRRVALRALLPLLPAAFMQTLTLTLLGPLIFTLAPHLGVNYWGMVAVLVVGAVVAYASLPLTGRVADRGRARLAVTLGFALLGLALAGFAAAPPVWVLYVLAVIAGLGYAFIAPGWAALVTGTLPEGERPAAWGVLMTVENAGTALGPLVGTFAFQRLGMSGPFLIGAALALLTAAGYVLFRRAFPGRRGAQPT
ncbi:MFS transporter [Deinococcus metallilatus]|uniref:MFS family permease n=1 Tax=Deinococcus metallilatus TaxID=1211322 RepID=A0AAJ5F282_9DEIO|nr:MFS transporter [Deinococcus metallilatus]MBB5295858.1 MFS family permease [Deinococcus metallilatus]QBY08301.1 MFS transporter [Deinococcus metallilatus]RXJ12032.1 MFS transporter [Deinococcus metallilatus]TLK25736.1 MFS transporter [Deinococcus metallilatus]GMA14611.1 MFS transporter [Deinococcus metallilatus]